jgi:plastocyanin
MRDDRDDPNSGAVRRSGVAGRSLIAVIVAAVVTIGAAAFALGRGVASDSNSSSSATTAASSGQPQGPSTAVEIIDFAFSPETVTVKVGSAITWTNGDGFAHSVKSADGSFVSQDLQQGQSYASTFTTPGSYAYVCGIHNSMTGTVVVEP